MNSIYIYIYICYRCQIGNLILLPTFTPKSLYMNKNFYVLMFIFKLELARDSGKARYLGTEGTHYAWDE